MCQVPYKNSNWDNIPASLTDSVVGHDSKMTSTEPKSEKHIHDLAAFHQAVQINPKWP